MGSMFLRLLFLSVVLTGCASSVNGTLEKQASGVGLAADDDIITVQKLPTTEAQKIASAERSVPTPVVVAKSSPDSMALSKEVQTAAPETPVDPSVVERPVAEATGPIEDNAAVVWLSQEGYEYNAGGVFCAGVDVTPQSKQKKIEMACSDGEMAKLKFVQTSAAEVNGQITLADSEVRDIIVLAR